MNILLASVYHLSAYCGGNEQYFHQIATGLVHAGHTVTYLTGLSADNQAEYNVITKPLPHLAGKPFVSTHWQKTLSELRPDIVHCSGSGLALLQLGFAARRNHIPAVLTFQAFTHPTNPLFYLPAKVEQSLVPYAFNGVISTTPTYQELITKLWKHTPVTFIPMMVAPHVQVHLSKKTARNKLSIAENKQVLLFVGTLSSHQYYKGVEILLEAIRQLPAPYMAVIVGDGDRRAYFERIAIKMGLDEKVIFAGHVSDQELSLYYSLADVFILPSTSNSEGFGLVLLEAMTHKLPVITTSAIGSASWLAQEDVAVLVKPKDPTALAEAIQKVDTAKCDRAYRFARSFTRKSMVEKTVAFYTKIIQKEQ